MKEIQETEKEEKLSKNKKIFFLKDKEKEISFNKSISAIKHPKEENIKNNLSENILNISNVSLIKKSEQNINSSNRGNEYKSTENISTQSKRKQLLKIFSNKNLNNKENIILLKNSSSNESDINKNKNSEGIKEDFFKEEEKSQRKKSLNSCDYFSEFSDLSGSVLDNENKLKDLLSKFDKSRTNSFITNNFKNCFNRSFLNDEKQKVN